jgi:hypothetical protein
MEYISILREAQPRFSFRRNLLENPTSYGAGVTGDGAELG